MTNYSFLVKFKTHPGKREELISILLKAAKLMLQVKGCLYYIVCKDLSDEDTVCVYELWETEKDHDDSLSIPQSKELIMRAMPLLNGKPEGTKLEVVGGKGI